jgi:hypothetical protein
MTAACAWITHPDCRLHEMGAGHPECPDRLDAIADHFVSTQLMQYLEPHEAPLATPGQLERAHASSYVRETFAASPAEGYLHLDPDTSMNPYSLVAALRSAGSAVLGAELVASGEVKRAFCAVMPSTTWDSRAWPWSTSTRTTATARRTSSPTTRACSCARHSSATSIPSWATSLSATTW